MIWIPPPSWIVATLLAMTLHVMVTGLLFDALGWRRGAAAIPVVVLIFLLSVALGVAVEIAVAGPAPLPIVLILGAGVFAAYALTMRFPQRRNEDSSHVIQN